MSFIDCYQTIKTAILHVEMLLMTTISYSRYLAYMNNNIIAKQISWNIPEGSFKRMHSKDFPNTLSTDYEAMLYREDTYILRSGIKKF